VPHPVAAAFAELVGRLGCNRSRALRNLTFWAGAGFSKAWQRTSPVGSELFTIDLDALREIVAPLALERLFGGDVQGQLSPAELRQVVYFLDMNEKYPEVRGRYYDRANIQRLRAGLRALVQRNFERRCRVDFFADGGDGFLDGPLEPAQEAIVGLVAALDRQVGHRAGLTHGLRTHFLTTNYDFVIETILDRVAGGDEHVFDIYRGITPMQVNGRMAAGPVPEHWSARNLLKLNGGFEIVPAAEGYDLDYRRRPTEALLGAPPVIMLPSREQDYTDPYFRSLFPKAVRLMRESAVLVLVGYSLSEDDALIRFVLRQFAEHAEDAVDKHVFYIDMAAEQHQRQLLREIFSYQAAQGVPELHLFDGDFAAFAAAAGPLIEACG
jgi:hypothetical protein